MNQINSNQYPLNVNDNNLILSFYSAGNYYGCFDYKTQSSLGICFNFNQIDSYPIQLDVSYSPLDSSQITG